MAFRQELFIAENEEIFANIIEKRAGVLSMKAKLLIEQKSIEEKERSYTEEVK